MGVIVKSGNGREVVVYGSWQEQETEVREKSFRVADTEAGIMAVAKALNFGWSDLRRTDDEAEKYAGYGITFKEYGRKAKHSQPIIVIANETMGYREISDDLRPDCYKDTITTYDDWDPDSQCGGTWTVDIYRLRPGLADGWIIIQSSSSCATVTAEKYGSSWLITLKMPLLDNGKTTGHSYEAHFASAKAWYQEQLKSGSGIGNG